MSWNELKEEITFDITATDIPWSIAAIEFTMSLSARSGVNMSLIFPDFSCTGQDENTGIERPYGNASNRVKFVCTGTIQKGKLCTLDEKIDKMNIEASAYAVPVCELACNIEFASLISAISSNRFSGLLLEYTR